MNILVSVMLFLMLFARPAMAQAPQAGDYVLEGGWGKMQLRELADNAMVFTINTLGSNGHSCELQGSILNSRAVLTSEGMEQACIIDFKVRQGAVAVERAAEGSCRLYCGARAWFEGNYYLPTPACTQQGKAKAQETFLSLYEAKAYDKAVAALKPVLSKCKTTLHWMEEHQLRNDIAIAQYHAGKPRACLATLKPVMERAMQDEATFRANSPLPPADVDAYFDIAKAAWFNAKLCARQAK